MNLLAQLKKIHAYYPASLISCLIVAISTGLIYMYPYEQREWIVPLMVIVCFVAGYALKKADAIPPGTTPRIGFAVLIISALVTSLVFSVMVLATQNNQGAFMMGYIFSSLAQLICVLFILRRKKPIGKDAPV